MSTVVIQTQDSQLTVNGKLVYKDANNNWISQVTLTTKELEALNSHLTN